MMVSSYEELRVYTRTGSREVLSNTEAPTTSERSEGWGDRFKICAFRLGFTHRPMGDILWRWRSKFEKEGKEGVWWYLE